MGAGEIKALRAGLVKFNEPGRQHMLSFICANHICISPNRVQELSLEAGKGRGKRWRK